MLDRFAEQLRKARLKKGVTLQQMAAKTRIDFKFLEAIDNGNFGFLPELYVKAFIRQYAKAVDLDEQEIVKKYDAAKAGKLIDDDEPKSLLERKVEIKKEETKPKYEKVTPIFDGTSPEIKKPVSSNDVQKTLKVLIYASGIVLAGVIVFFSFFNRSSTIVVEELPYEKILEETKDRYKVKVEKDDSMKASLIADSLTLQFVNVDSLDPAWVMVIYDDRKKEDFLLYPKNTKTVQAADNFKFTLGNSGVIVIRLNNQQLNFEGKRGSVRHFEVTKAGIQKLSAPPIIKTD